MAVPGTLGMCASVARWPYGPALRLNGFGLGGRESAWQGRGCGSPVRVRGIVRPTRGGRIPAAEEGALGKGALVWLASAA